MKPAHELSEIIRRYGQSFLACYPQCVQVRRTLRAIRDCRSAALGGHVGRCDKCGKEHNFYNSCRNRHCPKCQAVNRERWIMQRERELLPVGYYHLVFTLPHALNELAMHFPREVYNALFRSGWATLRSFASDHRYLGAKTGMTAILHTWGQNLSLHPHIHCIVPAGGITQSGRWKHARYRNKYLFPKRAMSKVFRARFMKLLRASGVHVAQSTAKQLFSKPWVVYAKRPFSKPEDVVEYLGRYSHKVAISNHRLRGISNDRVYFTAKNYRKGGQREQASLDAHEFIRRFCQHILPSGFVRIRHYGILASRNKTKELNYAREDLGKEKWERAVIPWEVVAEVKLGIVPGRCPYCKKGNMVPVAGIDPVRGPPQKEHADILRKAKRG